jgi:hypothetical protein
MNVKPNFMWRALIGLGFSGVAFPQLRKNGAVGYDGVGLTAAYSPEESAVPIFGSRSSYRPSRSEGLECRSVAETPSQPLSAYESR